ncbi:hypothetical protein [Ekhidna sp.]|uniref:hypothetical protein n=1 Tax=Ekhidna sp. TaxID=2608089 RepID=UPI003296DB6F
MAEEIDIKSVWNRSKAKEDPSSLQIDKLERKGTRTTLYWIKIILWIEFSLTILSMPFLIIYVTSRGDSVGLIAFYVFISIIYLFYYQFLIREIRRFNYDGNVLQSLKKLYGYLRFYVLHYYVVFWISLVVGFIYGMLDPANEEALSTINSREKWIAVIAIWAALLAIIGSFFHLLIYLIYGRKLKRIRKMVKDLESNQ